MQARDYIAYSVFPARAGVILPMRDGFSIIPGFPRTRGGDPDTGEYDVQRTKFSPHARG